MTTVSILMPVLNEEASLVDAAESALGQVGCDLELLIIDGCSADRTREVALELAERDPRVRVLSNPDVIIPAALNVGLAQARGEFVARIDGHARVNPDYIAQALAWMTTEPRLAAVGGRRIGVARTPVGRSISLAQSSPFGVGNSINHYATERQLTDHASFGVYRTEAARAIGGWDARLAVNEDVDFDHRLRAAGHLIGYIPTMRIEWHVRERLSGLFRQYRRYGRGKAAMIRKNGAGAIRPRHLVPPAAVAGGAAVLTASVLRPRLLLGLAPYAALIAWATRAGWRDRDRDAPASLAALPAALVVLHTSWGLGMLEGLLLRRPPALASGNSATRSPAEPVRTGAGS